MKPDLLFVYGTLREGQGNNHLLQHEGVKFLGPTTIKGYGLYDLGAFPAVKKEHSDNIVHGDLYRITSDDVWSSVDCLEGHPTFYERTLCALNDSNSTPVWLYIFKGPVGSYINSGNWLEFKS